MHFAVCAKSNLDNLPNTTVVLSRDPNQKSCSFRSNSPHPCSSRKSARDNRWRPAIAKGVASLYTANARCQKITGWPSVAPFLMVAIGTTAGLGMTRQHYAFKCCGLRRSIQPLC